VGKYTNLDSNVFAIFGSNAWNKKNIKTYPANFIAVGPSTEFIKVAILPNEFGVNRLSVAGVMIIEIYTPAGNGPKRASAIADELDTFLANKSQGSGGAIVQFAQSSVSPFGPDSVNKSLYRTTYTIPFNYFEVLK
jgi:hypothetical protein